ncbi:extra-large guanine nucleotide-binding protein 1-like [Apium graveolens]|uniref:extra-large guanine nucleotide-binding protein 1-like n=1 Tax=Apium graveolens TaxID=4045 RepID=UPI003D7BD809
MRFQPLNPDGGYSLIEGEDGEDSDCSVSLSKYGLEELKGGDGNEVGILLQEESDHFEEEDLSKCLCPHLVIGHPIMQNASNGNTKILVNNREITKPELWVMQWAGIQCEGQPHFWCSADGSFQEVG